VKYAVEVGSGVIHTKFHKDWFRHSKVSKWGYADRMEIA
jgi:hypothetical protein